MRSLQINPTGQDGCLSGNLDACGSSLAEIGRRLPAPRPMQRAHGQLLWHKSCSAVQSLISLGTCREADHLAAFGPSQRSFDRLEGRWDGREGHRTVATRFSLGLRQCCRRHGARRSTGSRCRSRLRHSASARAPYQGGQNHPKRLPLLFSWLCHARAYDRATRPSSNASPTASWST
jgi:hypothetical protein